MIIDEEKEALAAEYVLGTLDEDERTEAQAMVAIDPAFAALIAAWERRLGELNVLVAPHEAPAPLWDKIKTQIAALPQGPDEKAAPPDEASSTPAPAATASVTPEAALAGEVEAVLAAKPKKRRLAPAVAVLMTLVAAGLGGLIVVREVRPDLLPQPLKPTPVIRTVEVEKRVEIPSPRPAQYVAVLQRDEFAPAFVLTFDLERHVVAVRAMHAERQEGRTYQLWLVSEKLAGPRSLGLIGSQEFTLRPALATFDTTTLNSATYVVSVEPEGGSPTGIPTGPVIYKGRLVQTTPPGFPAETP